MARRSGSRSGSLGRSPLQARAATRRDGPGTTRRELAGASVILLEAGSRVPRWQIVENFRNSPAKGDFTTPYPSLPFAPHPEYAPANHYLIQKGDYPYNAQYLRLVGGTTWHWAAAAWRLLPSDFKLKTMYGVGRDWPFPYEALEPWYFAAEVELGVSGPDMSIDLGSPRAQPYPMAQLPLSYMDARFTDVLNANGFVVGETLAILVYRTPLGTGTYSRFMVASFTV